MHSHTPLPRGVSVIVATGEIVAAVPLGTGVPEEKKDDSSDWLRQSIKDLECDFFKSSSS